MLRFGIQQGGGGPEKATTTIASTTQHTKNVWKANVFMDDMYKMTTTTITRTTNLKRANRACNTGNQNRYLDKFLIEVLAVFAEKYRVFINYGDTFFNFKIMNF